jgi:hypothetical protein
MFIVVSFGYHLSVNKGRSAIGGAGGGGNMISLLYIPRHLLSH